VTDRDRAEDRRRPVSAPRVGFFGHLGACNIGNDASLEAVLRYVKAEYPDAVLDAMCPGPQRVQDHYGLDAIPMLWYQRHEGRVSGWPAVAFKVLGRGLDTFRMASWVRRHNVVIVPGAGVLEASLPLWPWGMPYALFVVCACGRLFGTKVAFVSVGAGVINKRITRWLSNSAARLAYYRSFRDAGARDALAKRGVDTSRDHVFTDLAFALPMLVPDFAETGNADIVGVGVMAYHGSNDDRSRANEIFLAYVQAMTEFVTWLVDNGRLVRLFIGDTNGSDHSVVQDILAHLRRSRPQIDPSQVVAEPVLSFADVEQAMQRCAAIVGIRYHNIVAALKIAKPAISISYSPKHDLLMSELGLSEFCLPVNGLDGAQMIKLFTELDARSAQLRQQMLPRAAALAERASDQFAELSTVLFPAAEPDAAPAPPEPGLADNAHFYKREFWSTENLKFGEPWYRLEKCARLITKLADGRNCSLLDVGCGPATLMRMLPPAIEYYGIDIAIHNPAPNLIETDFVETEIAFRDQRFDLITAFGVFEYVGSSQSAKLAEIASLLNPGGKFVVSYTNFGHRKAEIYSAFSNVQALADFRADLGRYFSIDRNFPASHNWKHGQPARKLVKAINMRVNVRVPVISPVLAVEHFFVCSPIR